MGAWMTSSYRANFGDPDLVPRLENGSKFDPNFGYDEPREERIAVATMQEMEEAQLKWFQRDYCAQHLITWMTCRRDTYPWSINGCKHERHIFDECEFDDYVMRMKEYERERRLLNREKRKKLKAAKEAAAE